MAQFDLVNAFTYHAPKEGQVEKYQKIRDWALHFAQFIDENVPESREKSLALTHLEQCTFYANAGIARHE